MKEHITITGEVHVKLVSEDGTILMDETFKNLIVNTGAVFIASRIVSNATTLMSHMALGTSSVATNLTNTTLGNEIGRTSITSSTSSLNVVTFQATFGPGVATGTLREAGIFNSGTSNSGTMLNRVVFSPVAKASTDTLYITWTVTVK